MSWKKSESAASNEVGATLEVICEERRERGHAPTLVGEALARIKGARILLVEDNELNQAMAIDLLCEAGLVVDLAGNGEIAVRKVKEMFYDIVLMDMQMPVMDGITATQAIRKFLSFEELPIVAMTANALEGDRRRCLEAGMNDHVAKPVKPEDLWKALQKWIKDRHLLGEKRMAVSRPVIGSLIHLDIARLDMMGGLRRVLGKGHLYLSLLRRFVAGQKGTAAEIRAALDGNDPDTAERIAHSTKGVAGNIGATQVQALAAEIERAIKKVDPHETIEALLEVLELTLSELIAALEAALPPEKERVPITVDVERLVDVCVELEALLSDDDSAAAHLFDENNDLLHAAFPNHYRQLDVVIKSFDFEAALVVLRTAVATSI